MNCDTLAPPLHGISQAYKDSCMPAWLKGRALPRYLLLAPVGIIQSHCGLATFQKLSEHGVKEEVSSEAVS